MMTMPLPFPAAVALFAIGLQLSNDLPKIPAAHHCPMEITATRVFVPGTSQTSVFALLFDRTVVGIEGRFYGPRQVPGPDTVIRPCNKRTLASVVNPDPHDVCAPESNDPDPGAEFFFPFKRKFEFHPVSGDEWGSVHLAYARWVEFSEIDFADGYKWRSSRKSTCAFVLEHPSAADRKRSVMRGLPKVDTPFGPPAKPPINDHN